jgi:hypothetical protein
MPPPPAAIPLDARNHSTYILDIKVQISIFERRFVAGGMT